MKPYLLPWVYAFATYTFFLLGCFALNAFENLDKKTTADLLIRMGIVLFLIAFVSSSAMYYGVWK